MHARGCLEPEVVAAYLDRGLSLAERARVEAHLASCPQCTALLAGVVRTVAEIAPALPDIDEARDTAPLVSRRAAAGAAIAAAAVLAVLAAPSFVGPWLERDTGRVSLAGNVVEHRSVLGRLTGGFPHAPLDAASAGGQDVRASETDRVLLTAGRIRESVGETATPSRLHALGVSQLLERRYDDAALLLLAASREQPANARYLNDVATVQLERARRGLRPDDLPRALAAADRARRLDPSLNEAWFNRALAMSALQLTDQAKTAWADYLRRDSTSPWASEARAQLESLSKPSAADTWAGIESQLQQSIDSSSADAAVRAQTSEARNYIENTLIVNWADAVLAGVNADAPFARLQVMADSMMRVAGDAMYVDAAARIARASGADAKRRLAQAHKDYARASALFNQDNFREAQPALTAARTQFAEFDSPFGVLADVQLAAVDFVGGRYAAAEENFARAFEAAASRNYAYASGRATWFRGLIAYAQTRMAEAQSYYEDTLATFEKMGDVEQASMAHALLSGLHDLLGNSTAEWEHRRRSFALLGVSSSSRFRSPILLASAVAIRDEEPDAALVMLDAAIAEARRTGRDAAVVDGLAQRAATLHRLGRASDAQQTVGEARDQLGNVRDDNFRRLFEIPVLSVESDLLRQSNPQAAAAVAQRAIETAEARGDRARLPQLQLRLAKASIVWGNLDAAERALTTGIAAFDDTRAKPTGATGVAAFDESWELFETGVQLAIRRGDYERAFALAERGRLRNVVIPSSGNVSLADVQRAQQPDQAIVAVNQFDDELALWVIRRTGTTVLRRPINRTDAAAIIARQSQEIRLETSQPAAGSVLYDEIIRPISPLLEGIDHIVFIPDATYRDMSIAALWDRTRERFLIESWTISESPSATLAARDVRSARPDSVLVISAEPNDGVAKTIAAGYRQANLVLGPEATRARMLAGSSSVLHVAAPAVRSSTYPAWSRFRLSDEPGRRYSGAVAGRDIATRQMPNTHLVVLDELTPEQRYRTAGTFDLATAFLAAGVPAVLGTLPGADEPTTRELMVGFHRQLAAQVPAAEALARVQRNALQQNGRRLGAWTALVIYGSDR